MLVFSHIYNLINNPQKWYEYHSFSTLWDKWLKYTMHILLSTLYALQNIFNSCKPALPIMPLHREISFIHSSITFKSNFNPLPINFCKIDLSTCMSIVVVLLYDWMRHLLTEYDDFRLSKIWISLIRIDIMSPNEKSNNNSLTRSIHLFQFLQSMHQSGIFTIRLIHISKHIFFKYYGYECLGRHVCNVVVVNSMIYMYANYGSIEKVHKLFDMMQTQFHIL